MSENMGTENKVTETNGKGKGFVVGALVGAAVGAITALLVAPKSGKELRKDISVQARNVSDKTQEIACNIGEKTQKLAGNVKDKTQKVAKNVSETATEWAGIAKDAATNVVSEVKSIKAARSESAAAEVVEELVEAAVEAADAIEGDRKSVV